MIKDLLTAKRGGIYEDILLNARDGLPVAVFGVSFPEKCRLAATAGVPVVFIVRDGVTAEKAVKEIMQMSGEKAVYLPPKDDVLLFKSAFNKDRLYKRLSALYEIREGVRTVVTTFEALSELFPKKIDYLKIVKDEDYDLYEVIEKLVSLGYARVPACDRRGTFSVRGDILEVFPINSELCYRAEFFGDTVEKIKDENGNETTSFTAITSSDVIISKSETERIKEKLKLSYSKYGKLIVKSEAVKIYNALTEKLETDLFDDSLQYVFPLIENSTRNFFDIFSENALVIYDECKITLANLKHLNKEFYERYDGLLRTGDALDIIKEQFVPEEELLNYLSKAKKLAVETLNSEIAAFRPLKTYSVNRSPVTRYFLNPKELISDAENWKLTGYSVLVAAGDEMVAEGVYSELKNAALSPKYFADVPPDISGICVTPERLDQGFISHDEKLAVIGTGDITVKKKKEKSVKRKRNDLFSAPTVGDFAVHETFGVGVIRGVKKISTVEGTKAYVELEYAGGDRLYVSTDQMDKLSKYLGGSETPSLNRIGGGEFERIKERVRKSIAEMTINLKKLYAERKAKKGFEFSPDNALTEEFENSFEYEETEDQLLSLEEIKSDMQSCKVMDRLLCGDVGFGKTEIAFRACFKAICDGKQAAIVAPTTILAEQHFRTAIERFKGFGVRTGVLNRFRSSSEIKATIESLKNGDVDLIIGTHRLFSKDIKFHDLGLLVIDEEQRFGVEHKEKLKLIKENVDTLTLSATPIPRTLHLSLSGIRDISTINTPPKQRIPVQTIVSELTDSLIKDALYRELSRGGQAFVLYNRVDTIYKFADRIKTLVPEAKVIVAHGQMPEKTLENGVNEFYSGKADVLVATTIIENGIDMPRANTLIVESSDKLGLSTLYQLKGRVGRGNLMAYAYFTYPENKVLTEEAYKRLTALMEYTEMGSGYKIAMRDLEIRGAGNVLGKQQHGHMDKVGYELYGKLLKEELGERVKGEETELDIKADAYIPDGYIEDETARMEAYKQIAEIRTENEAERVTASLKDSFGKLPEEVVTLIKIAVLKSAAYAAGASEISISMKRAVMLLKDIDCLKGGGILKAVNEYKGSATLSFGDFPTVTFSVNGGKPANEIALMTEFLTFALKNNKN